MTGTLKLALAVWLAVGSLAIAEEVDPFTMPKEYFATSVRTIALAPFTLPIETADASTLRADLESRIRKRLEAKGYEVVPSSVFHEQWIHFAKKLGGVFDPVTGDANTEEWDTVFEYTTRQLRTSHDIDAVAFPSVLRAPLAVWDSSGLISPGYAAANDEQVMWEGAPLPLHPLNRPQMVVGNHLVLEIRDINGEQMYGIVFPIEIVETFVAGGHEEKPPAEQYKNDAWIDKAFDTVVGPLPAQGKPGE